MRSISQEIRDVAVFFLAALTFNLDSNRLIQRAGGVCSMLELGFAQISSLITTHQLFPLIQISQVLGWRGVV